MNDEEYLEELKHRILEYMDLVSRLRPEIYKDIKRYQGKVDVYKSLIRDCKDEIKRVEVKIKEAKDESRRPRIN